MSGIDALRRLQTGERRRRALIVLVGVLPWVLVVALMAWPWHEGGAWISRPVAWLMLVALLTISLRWAWRDIRAVDDAWLWRRMDAKRCDLEDSAGLLFDSTTGLGLLPRLQKIRLQQRLQDEPLPDLRTPWPRQALLASGLMAIALVAVASLWNGALTGSVEGSRSLSSALSNNASITQITRQSLDVEAPAYTGLAATHVTSLQAKVPEGSTLRWNLRFAPQPATAELVFHDGSRLPLQRRGGAWTASRQLNRSTFYRLQLKSVLPLPAARPYRIDVIADQPPQIKVSEPDRTLILLKRKRAQWPLVFEASDDFGLGAAQLRITLAQGTGENISVTARTLTLKGQGNGRRQSFRHQLDLGALGFSVGDDLVVRLSINDNRSPAPHTARSASFILRWPADLGAEATGVDVVVKRVLPAYFRSQRQIIIDSEALLAQRRKLDADNYLKHADEIGVDQRILRLRYGEFLGQETSEPTRPPRTQEAVTLATAEPTATTDSADQQALREAAVRAANPEAAGHDQADAAATTTMGHAESVVEEFGHVHDEPEAATLLDPETRSLLKSALDQMWQAELNLRQGQVEKALPYEYRALRFIKQVQQATRIYLARVGVEMAPVDLSRRMSGDRKGVQSARDALRKAQIEASPALALWQALDSGTARQAGPELDAFENWLRIHEPDLPDALNLFAAVDAVRREPDCADCAFALRGRLWSLLPARAPAVDSRRVPDASGRAYLESLKSGPGS